MKRIAVDGLPAEPLAAAGAFHQLWLPQIEGFLGKGDDALIALAPAGHAHRAWRRAVTADLARTYAPRRCNMVAGDAAAVTAFADYLAAAPGITGQYFEADAAGAGDPTA